MSVWISDEKLLIFASLISPSKMILFEKKYQTFDTVFHHQMKHCISCLIYYIKNLLFYCLLANILSNPVSGLCCTFKTSLILWGFLGHVSWNVSDYFVTKQIMKCHWRGRGVEPLSAIFFFFASLKGFKHIKTFEDLFCDKMLHGFPCY